VGILCCKHSRMILYRMPLSTLSPKAVSGLESGPPVRLRGLYVPELKAYLGMIGQWNLGT